MPALLLSWAIAAVVVVVVVAVVVRFRLIDKETDLCRIEPTGRRRCRLF